MFKNPLNYVTALIAALLLMLGVQTMTATPASAQVCSEEAYVPWFDQGVKYGGQTRCSSTAGGAVRLQGVLEWDRTWPNKDRILLTGPWSPWEKAPNLHTWVGQVSCSDVRFYTGQRGVTLRSIVRFEGTDGSADSARSGGAKLCS